MEIPSLFKQHFNIRLSSYYPANGSGDLAGGEPGGCYLIKQGLKGVVVLTVDKGDLNGEASYPSGRSQPSEAASYHNNSGLWIASHIHSYRDSWDGS
jgi:hypothetical protein